MADWEKIGELPVDSATLFLGDPVYGLVPDEKNAKDDWKPFIQKAISLGLISQGFAKFDDPRALGTLGLAVSSGGSDGVFPVYIRRSPDGLVADVSVLFD